MANSPVIITIHGFYQRKTKSYVKPNQLTFIACLMILLILTLSSVTIPTVSGATQAIPEKALLVLNDAVGIDNQKYIVDQRPISDSKYFGATQKNVDSYLTSPDSKCRVVTSYVNDQLHKIYFSNYEGEISLKYKESNAIEIAKGFLGRLGNQTKDSLYTQLVANLQDINHNQNITKCTGSMQLKFENTDNKTIRYRWTYVDSNGVPAERKNIVLSYEEGQLKSYTNNWQLFEVKGKPNISEKQALEIAMDASKDFSYNITNEKGEVETIFGPFALADTTLARASLGYVNLDNQKDARGGNPFELYPSWYVTLGFSQFYPGDVSGITVLIWADTGEVSRAHEIVTNSQIGRLDETTSASITNPLQIYDQTLTGAVMVSLLFVAGLLFGVRIVNKKTIALDRRLTSKFPKIFVFPTLVILGISLVIPLAGAIVPDSMSRIYTYENPSELSGFMDYTINVAEGAANGEVADYVEQRFVNHGGYFTDKNRGGDFTKSNVISYIASDEASYSRTAILVISHFRERGCAFLPNSGLLGGERIRDSEIYPYASEKHFFTFLWVCNQAENREYTNGKVWPHYMGNDYNEGSGGFLPKEDRGMPIAWTGRDGYGNTWMNFDGYQYPDGSGQCYISFYGMSPMLGGLPSNTFMDIDGDDCKEFIKQFYHYALDFHYSVWDSLNQASQYHFNDLDYVQCPLYVGYDSYWPGGATFSGIWTAADGAAVGLCPSGKKFLNQSGYYPIDYYYLPSENQIENCTAAPNEMRVHGDSGIFLTVAGDPDPVTLHVVSPSGSGVTSPPTGNYVYGHNEIAHVEAFPAEGWVLGEWYMGGRSWGAAEEISITMDREQYLQAVFIPEPTYRFVSHIPWYEGTVDHSELMIGPYPDDGNEAFLSSYSQPDAQVICELNREASYGGAIWLYGRGEDDAVIYVRTSLDGYSWSDYSGWNVPTSGSSDWFYCGMPTTPFRYIDFVVPQDSQELNNVYIDCVEVDPIEPRHVTILASEGGTTDPGPGYYETSGYPQITVYSDWGWNFVAWEFTVGEYTWYEDPWNPCDVIYDYATVRPIFEPW